MQIFWFHRHRIVEQSSTAFITLYAHQQGGWVCGDEGLPVLDSYCCLGIEFSSGGSWDKHIKSLKACNKQKLGGLYKVSDNFSFDLRSRKHILMAVL